jgi:hypothetical protein
VSVCFDALNNADGINKKHWQLGRIDVPSLNSIPCVRRQINQSIRTTTTAAEFRYIALLPYWLALSISADGLCCLSRCDPESRQADIISREKKKK